jgi:hypothetical protein
MQARSLFALVMLAIAAPVFAVPVQNPSFELPTVEGSGFPAIPSTDSWIQGGPTQTTGVFPNPATGSTSDLFHRPNHIDNMDQAQAAFMSAAFSVSLRQDLGVNFDVGTGYSMTVAVCTAADFVPNADPAIDSLQLIFYYLDNGTPIDIGSGAVFGLGSLTATHMEDFTVALPIVTINDPWHDKPMGIAIRALHPDPSTEAGIENPPQGAWDLDNVRVVSTAESVPEPATLGVLALGSAGLLLRRRRA